MELPGILLVDDEEDFLKAISIGLKEKGLNVKTAGSGEQALNVLETFTPELVITDLRMQPMNGFDLYQQVRKIPRLAKVRFFFLTGINDSLAEKYGKTLGAEAYLVKPIDIDMLELTIKKALKKK
jgi:DNA-binding response OmpR family regulator